MALNSRKPKANTVDLRNVKIEIVGPNRLLSPMKGRKSRLKFQIL